MSATADPFACSVVPRREIVHVCPTGEIDLDTVGEVEARLAELHLAGFDRIVLDLRAVTFFDSTGVHLVVRWSRRAREEGFQFGVIVGNDVVARVLRMTGVEQHLTLIGTG
jgi:anti-anti-sigma factor